MTIAINTAHFSGVMEFLSAMQNFVSEVNIATDGQRGGWTMRIISDDVGLLPSSRQAKDDGTGRSVLLKWYGARARVLNCSFELWEE